MVAAGTSLSTLQQRDHAATQTKKYEQSTIQNLFGKFAEKGLKSTTTTYRSRKSLNWQMQQCSLEERTLGNDNSVDLLTRARKYRGQ